MMISREKIVNRFCLMGKWIEEDLEKSEFEEVIRHAFVCNGWFCEQFVRSALMGIASWLRKDVLENFIAGYAFTEMPKRIAVIAAGNIPAVGFHDIMCVLLSGNKAVCKLSSKDEVLLPFLFGKFFKDEIVFEKSIIADFDAVIATGSNNSALHFESYFGKYPHIIRHNRHSVAVLSGNESKEDLAGLAEDMLLYAGLGCRSVSKLFVLRDYDFEALRTECKAFNGLLDLNKYRNNIDYHRAIFIMNNRPFVDLGNLLLIENKETATGVSVVNYQYYEDLSEVKAFIDSNKENLQIVVSNLPLTNTTRFGKGQRPDIDEFADGVDTMKWLNNL